MKIRAALVVYLDIETFWSDDYTLRTLTPFEFALDDRFQLHGAAVAVDLWQDEFSSVLEPTWIPHDELRERLATIFSRRAMRVYVVCHNTLFDVVALTLRGYLPDLPSVVFADTASLARAHLLHAGVTGGSVSLAACTGGGKTDVVVNKTRGVRREVLYASPELLQELAVYCCQDVALTRRLWRWLAPITPPEELRLIDAIVRATARPALRLDVQALKEHHDAIVASEEEQLASLGLTRDELMSNGKFVELLQSLGVSVPMKLSPATGELIPAVSRRDEEFADLVYHPNKAVADLVELRLKVKSTLERTRASRLLGIARATPDALLPAPLRYYGAHTGRFSGEWRLNLQNLPRGSRLRKAIMALPGRKLVVFDFAQIEARILAWLAGQDDLVEQFRAKEDVYSTFASAVYGVPVSKTENVHLRHIGKVCILSLGYGGGPQPLRLVLNAGVPPDKRISLDDAQFLVQQYRQRMSSIVALWRGMDDLLGLLVSARAGQEALRAVCAPQARLPAVLAIDRHPVTKAPALRLPNGLWLQYFRLRSTEDGLVYNGAKGETRIYGPKLVENIVQALARVVMTDAVLRVADKVPDAKFVLSLHDSVVFDVDAGRAETMCETIRQAMLTPPAWGRDLPVAVDGGTFDVLP